MPASPEVEPRLLPALILALAVGAAAAVAVAWPDLGGLASGLPGRWQDDGLGAIYLHHHVHDALIHGHLSLADPDQLVPVGFEMAAANGGNVLEMLVSGLFRLVLPWPTWLSVAAFALIPLNVLAFVPLGLRLWGRAGPAVAAGVAWAVFPPVLHQVSTLRLTQVVMFGLPLAVLGLLDLGERGGRRAAVTAGAGLALAAVGYWFQGLFLALLAPLFLAWGLRTRGWRPLARDSLLAAGVALVAVAPFLLLVVLATLRQGGSGGSPISSDQVSPDFPDALRLLGPQPDSARGFLPWAVVLGGLVGLVRGRRRLLWLGLGLVCLVFALGPGQEAAERLWLLPWYPLWKWVPGIDRMSHPDRWLPLGGLFLVILAVDGLVGLPGRRVAVWLVPLGVLTQLHSGFLPLGTWRPDVPDVWADLATRPGGGGVVVVPFMNAGPTCAWQPFHHRPLVGGMVERERALLPSAWLDWADDNELLLSLYALSTGVDEALAVYQDDLDKLRAAGVDTVVWDRVNWDRNPRVASIPVVKRLTDALGRPVFSGNDGATWVLPEAGRPGEAPASGRSVADLPDVAPGAGGMGPPPGAPGGPRLEDRR